MIAERRFAGGIDAEGKGWVPNITPHADGIANWSAKDIAYLLETGTHARRRLGRLDHGGRGCQHGKLSPEDRAAMAAYLKSLPPRPGKAPPKK